MSVSNTTLLIAARYELDKTRLIKLMADLNDSGECYQTTYLGANSDMWTTLMSSNKISKYSEHAITQMYKLIRDSDSLEVGAVLFWCTNRVWMILPPFPLPNEPPAMHAETGPLVKILEHNLIVGVILLRLGRYSVGVLRGQKLLNGKSESRYVKNRHRAGGSSQRRFERSRERLIRELFDKVCQSAEEVFLPFENRINYFLLGGEHHTLQKFLKRCNFLKQPSARILKRRLSIHDPNSKELSQIHNEVWRSRVIVFTQGDRS